MKQTASQTVGPYFAYGLSPEQYLYDFKAIVDGNIVDINDPNRITIMGRVIDGEGNAIPDALVEIWDSSQTLFGRFGTGTEKNNNFIFNTLKPKKSNSHAPHLNVILFMRGQLIHSYTRIYFSDEDNSSDEILNQVPADRQKTLIAEKKGNVYQFDIYMQGENETVFFNI